MGRKQKAPAKANNQTRVGHVSHSQVTINQSNFGGASLGDRYIEYMVDESKPPTAIRRRTVAARGGLGLLSGLAAMAVSVLGLVSDIRSVFSLDAKSWFAGVGIAVLALGVGALINLKFIRMLPLFLWGSMEEYVGYGRFASRTPENDVVQYYRVAKCAYPRCNGIVRVEGAPPLERSKHALVGVCSVGGKLHTYTVDANNIGYPREFDWSEPESKGE
ncbi:MAG: hypothetical protein IT318_25850 [Anaerolineales bacterium]|nr:hypothetical protein [Anaerolineales bacterium]